MGKTKAFVYALGNLLIYGLGLKLATGSANIAFKINLPKYDWFLLLLTIFGVSLFAFLQESDRGAFKSIGGFLKYILLALYTYLIVIMSSYIEVYFGGRPISISLNWGLWLYIFLAPTLIQALIHLIKPFVKE